MRLDNMAWFWMLALVWVPVERVQAYGGGAPAGVCGSMTPKHRDAKAQAELSPYHFAVSSMENGDIEVIIEAAPGDSFRGFMVQPRQEDNRNKSIKGEFVKTSESKVINCKDGNNFLTHNNRTDKTKLMTKWTPPPDFEGNIVMRATVVRTAMVFWTNIDSPPLSVSRRESSTSVTTVTPPQGKSGLSGSDCGISRGCFGMPPNCDETSKCEILLAYAFDPSSNTVEFELMAVTGSSTNLWIAAGISEDKSMGDDSVGDCILANGKPSFHYSWNKGRTNSFGKSPEDLEVLETAADNGVLRCKWKRPAVTVENGKKFDVLTETYYLFLAEGQLEGGNSVEKAKHYVQQASDNKVNLTSVSIIRGSSDAALLVKVHGCLMVIAWVGLVSVGILLARHYKDAWSEKTLCNVKIWFAFHRGLMLLSVSMVLISFIIIFVHVGQWSSSATAHAVFGCISTALALLQPVGALFRPGPNDPKRPIFNWVHWSGGNIAQLAAFIAIFLAVEIQAAYLPSAFTLVFAIFIAYHCLFHLLFQIYVWQVEKKRSNEISMMEISRDKRNDPVATGDKFKKTMLAIYTFPVAGLVITLLFIIGLQKKTSNYLENFLSGFAISK